MTPPLDPLRLPLTGSHLIEASAGTGKTWTLSALYVRLVLGHGTLRPMHPGEILVMTFTIAATQELSGRIRKRLVEAAACFRAGSAPADDPFLKSLLLQHPEGDAREQAAWRLAMAAQAMDDAAIHTLDAWCQRMLREHAFDSGALFDEELQPDEASLRAQAVLDYWRQQVYPLRGRALAQVLARWKEPQALQRDLQAWREVTWPETTAADRLESVLADAAQQIARAREGWAQHSVALREWLEPLLAQGKSSPLNLSRLRPTSVQPWLDALQRWAADDAYAKLALPDFLQYLRPDRLSEALKANKTLEAPPVLQALATLTDTLQALPDLTLQMRQHAARWLRQREASIKQQAGRFGFADLQQRLDAALDPARHGAQAERLRARILAQFPVALVDEFQDTSPVQWRILDRLYRVAENADDRTLLLIGDPKQAIYAFRGADLYTYLQARRATEGRHHVLGTNHRSSQALVAAVNALFERAEARPGPGAFRFRPQGPNVAPEDNPLPFWPVDAQGRGEDWIVGGQRGPALTLCVDPLPANAETLRGQLAAVMAEQMVAWLSDAQTGFRDADGRWQRLAPGHIAVLVSNRTQAHDVRRQLSRRGIPSVYLSERDSVFQSEEAADLLRLLQAMAAPRDVRLARAALATRLMARSLDELATLAEDDARFDAACALLQQLQTAWRAHGVLSAVRQALHAFDLPARWFAEAVGERGERRATNVLHLAELLQAASAQQEGEAALLRWLQQQIELERTETPEDQLVRLESDAHRVQVLTVHGSKGLEFPVVMLPYASLLPQEHTNKQEPLLLPDAHGQRRWLLTPDEDDHAQAKEERLREGLRLLYVAVTRARHALWIGIGTHSRGTRPDWPDSAIGQVLGGESPVAMAEALQSPEALQQHPGLGLLQITPLSADADRPPVARTRWRAEAPPGHWAEPLPTPQIAARPWSVGSYSGLVRDAAWAARAEEAPLARTVMPLRQDEPEDEAAALPRALAPGPWHRFPRGALPGNFLHEQLEWLAAEGFALRDTPALQQALQRRCERQGWGHRSADVQAWLEAICHTALPPVQHSLAEVAAAPGGLLPEMEFWLPSDMLQARQVDLLCTQALYPGQPRPKLPERTLNGLLMGFADLVFEHGGRYWVLDYKSNALGPDDAAYTPEAMEAALLTHRYDVQAALYLLALHRLLAQRLGAAYRPEEQLGGALFLFLRGIASPSRGCLWVRPPLGLLDELDGLLAANGPSAAAQASADNAQGTLL